MESLKEARPHVMGSYLIVIISAEDDREFAIRLKLICTIVLPCPVLSIDVAPARVATTSDCCLG